MARSQIEKDYRKSNAKLALVTAAKQVRAWLSRIGSKGGSMTSDAKKRAVKKNGKRGGRPRKGTK